MFRLLVSDAGTSNIAHWLSIFSTDILTYNNINQVSLLIIEYKNSRKIEEGYKYRKHSNPSLSKQDAMLCMTKVIPLATVVMHSVICTCIK